MARFAPRSGKLVYQGGKSTFDTDRLNEIFRDEFDRAHYRVVGASGSLFADNSSAQGEYLLAGEVKQMHAEICYGGMSWDNPTADGEAFVEVKWEIYSALERKVVLERTTQGRRKIATARPGAEMEVFFDAFTLAMRDLAADRGLQDIVFNAEPDENADAGDEAGDQVAVQRFDVEIVPAAIVVGTSPWFAYPASPSRVYRSAEIPWISGPRSTPSVRQSTRRSAPP